MPRWRWPTPSHRRTSGAECSSLREARAARCTSATTTGATWTPQGLGCSRTGILPRPPTTPTGTTPPKVKHCCATSASATRILCAIVNASSRWCAGAYTWHARSSVHLFYVLPRHLRGYEVEKAAVRERPHEENKLING